MEGYLRQRYTVKGFTKTLDEWAKTYGVDAYQVNVFMNKGRGLMSAIKYVLQKQKWRKSYEKKKKETLEDMKARFRPENELGRYVLESVEIEANNYDFIDTDTRVNALKRAFNAMYVK